MSTFTDEGTALEEAEFLANQTGRRHSIVTSDILYGVGNMVVIVTPPYAGELLDVHVLETVSPRTEKRDD
ncbi:MAG: hypothetical protein V3S69_07950 [Dehalococcoidales bacterium]